MNIFLADEQDDPLSTDILVELAELVLTEEGFDDETEVSLFFVSDGIIAEYNERFMGKAGPTDVLAFPIEHLTPGEVPVRRRNDPPVTLGDVIIAPAYVRTNAPSHGSEFDDEVSLMVVHGILHLLGYDHGDDAEAEVMESRETVLLAKVGRKRR